VGAAAGDRDQIHPPPEELIGAPVAMLSTSPERGRFAD